MIPATGRPYALHTLRLLPGEDARAVLRAWAAQHGIEAAAIVSAVGSVRTAMLRFGGKREATALEGDLEVCALTGTLSRHGMHLHLAVADSEGRMSGGHLLEGTIVRTTLEVVIQEIGGLRFARRHDDRTGYDELFPEEIRP
ncbi:MAG: PPC domain-containing DNA-binding protein [Flavobacteriales bacterium]